MSELLKLSIKTKLLLFIKYLIIFTIVPIVGTLLHEFGHYIVAIANGYEAHIAYAYTTSTVPHDKDSEIYFYYILGGPVSTWIQSVVPFSLIIVYYNQKRREEITEDLPFLYIILLSFTSFCGRFIFNAGGYMFNHSKSLDESKMAAFLGINADVFVYTFAFVAWTILLIAIYMIPKHLRITIFFAAILGAGIGYFVWYYYLGPVILPISYY
ncbi:MAG: hypothetical protein ACTSR8_21405 [Promethearchaeota archaeon]